MRFDTRVLLAALLSCSAIPVAAQDKAEPSPIQREIIPGSELMKEVVRWNDRMNPKFTKKEIDDVVAYLNRDFYRFAQ